MNGFMPKNSLCPTGLYLCLSLLALGVTISCSGGQGDDPSAAESQESKGGLTGQEPAVSLDHSSWLSARSDDANTGISNSDLDAEIGEDVWTWDAAGRLWQSPVAKDGILYVGDGNLDFYAVRVADGKQLWRSRPRIIKTQDETVAGMGENLAERALPKDLDDHYGYSTPVLDDDQVITISEYGVMTAFALKDGKINWEHDFVDKVMSSPRIKGDKLLVNCTDGNFFAFDKNTGKELWRYWTSQKMLGSSCGFLGPDTAIFPAHDGFLHVVDIRNGQAIQRYELNKVSASTPLIAFGCAYFTTLGGGLRCFDLVDGVERWKQRGNVAGSHSLALSGENVLVHMRNELRAYHGVTGHLTWKTKLVGNGAVAPCVGKKLIYMTCGNANAYGIDPKTGEIKWQAKFGDSSRCQPVLIDGLLIVSNFKGRMTAFK